MQFKAEARLDVDATLSVGGLWGPRSWWGHSGSNNNLKYSTLSVSPTLTVNKVVVKTIRTQASWCHTYLTEPWAIFCATFLLVDWTTLALLTQKRKMNGLGIARECSVDELQECSASTQVEVVSTISSGHEFWYTSYQIRACRVAQSSLGRSLHDLYQHPSFCVISNGTSLVRLRIVFIQSPRVSGTLSVWCHVWEIYNTQWCCAFL